MSYIDETGIDISLSTQLKTQLDTKLSNYYPDWDNYTMIVEDIPTYLSRIISDIRSAGVPVTMLIPKEDSGISGTATYNYDTFDGSNYDTKYYAFIDGLADENFIEITSEHIYLAYASDNIGTDFTLDKTSKLPFEAKLISKKFILNPIVTDFIGLWRGSIGADSFPDTITLLTDNTDDGEHHTHKLELGTPELPDLINWVDVVSCVRDTNGDCTGLEVGYSKKIRFNRITNEWDDTYEHIPISRINYQACPLPYIPPIPRKAYTTVGKSYDQSIEREISPYANGLQITNVQAPGTNRQYFSIPFDRNLTVRNQVKQITYNKTTIQDNRPGYIDNYIWESSNMFATTNSTTFYITIS